MSEKIDPKEWAKEFELFMSLPEVTPPFHLSESILNYVKQDLNPSIWTVISKLGLIQVMIGSLSLLICSQFGMGGGSMLTTTFMGLGEWVCMAFCGGLFLGLPVLVALFTLSNSELRKIRRSGYGPIFVLGISSLTVFFCFGAEIALSLAIAWLFGGVAVGIFVTEAGLGIRMLVRQGL